MADKARTGSSEQPYDVFDAATLATGWLSVALAAGVDKETPELYRTVCVERFRHGLRLISTDRYLLLRTWVPNETSAIHREPALGTKPEQTVIARDAAGRGAGLFRYLLQETAGTEDEPGPTIMLRVTLDVTDPDGDPGTFDGMERRYVMVDYPDHERLLLEIVDAKFVDWRTVLQKFDGTKTEQIALNPELLSRIAKLGKLHGNSPLLWSFGGTDRMSLLEVAEADPKIDGMVMPVRYFGPEEDKLPEDGEATVTPIDKGKK